MSALRPILIVEDSDDDAELLKITLKQNRVSNPILHVPSGEEALALLARTGGPRPVLILLDLTLPGLDGHDFLLQLRSRTDDQLSRTPVCILSGSSDRIDMSSAFELRADAYVVKPFERQHLRRILEAVPRMTVGLDLTEDSH